MCNYMLGSETDDFMLFKINFIMILKKCIIMSIK